MTVYGYTRVSLNIQVDNGESLGVQERQIGGYAQMNGWEVKQTFVEKGVSGSIPLGDRPEGKELLNSLESGDIIIASKLDRAFRSALDALQVVALLNEKGVNLHLIDLGGSVSNGHSKMFLTIAASFAEAERDRIRERILDTKKDQKERNRFLGGKTPFGYKVSEEGYLVEKEDEQQAIQIINELRQKKMALRKISAHLKINLGITLSHVGVKRVLEVQI
ncbi:MAG: recombinase family protein [Candidatus Brocadiales bacterium]|nr:recombinase family protein [Candidatus Brocadiales bacterium]